MNGSCNRAKNRYAPPSTPSGTPSSDESEKPPEDRADAVAEALIQPRFVGQARRRLEGGDERARDGVRRRQVGRVDAVALGGFECVRRRASRFSRSKSARGTSTPVEKCFHIPRRGNPHQGMPHERHVADQRPQRQRQHEGKQRQQVASPVRQFLLQPSQSRVAAGVRGVMAVSFYESSRFAVPRGVVALPHACHPERSSVLRSRRTFRLAAAKRGFQGRVPLVIGPCLRRRKVLRLRCAPLKDDRHEAERKHGGQPGLTLTFPSRYSARRSPRPSANPCKPCCPG